MKMLMGVSAPSGVEPCRGRTTFTPNTQARLDELILLTRLSWDTWRRGRGGQEVGRFERLGGVLGGGALQPHLVQEAKEEPGDGQVMLRERLQHLPTPADPQAALHRCTHTHIQWSVM